MKPFVRYGTALAFAALVPSLIMGFGVSNRDPIYIFKFTLMLSMILCLFMLPIVLLFAKEGWINLLTSIVTGTLVAFIPFLLVVLERVWLGEYVSNSFFEWLEVIILVAPFSAVGGLSFWVVWYLTKSEQNDLPH